MEEVTDLIASIGMVDYVLLIFSAGIEIFEGCAVSQLLLTILELMD